MRRLASAVLPTLLLILLLLALSRLAAAQDGNAATTTGPVVLTGAQAEYPLGLHLELLEDPGGQLTIEQVASPEANARFTPSQVKTPNLGYTDSAYWVRFRSRNETAPTDDWRLELGFANMQHVTLYTPVAQPGSAPTGFVMRQTGTFYPFNTRDVPFHRFVFKLHLPAQAEQTFYLRFQNDASMTLPLTLWSAEAFAQASRSEEFILGIFYGILLIMLSLGAFLFLALRDKNYLYYSLFLAAFLLFQVSFDGHALQHLWPNMVGWNSLSVPISAAAVVLTALVFTAYFLQLGTRAPRLNRSLAVLQVVVGLVVLLTPFLSYRLVVRPIVALAIVSFLLMLGAGFFMWRRGYRPAIFYALSWTAFSMGIIVMSLARSGLTPSTALTEQSYLVGVIATVLFLAVALSDRINLLRAHAEWATHELRESESRLEQYLEAIPLGVSVRDAEGRLRYVNRHARQLANRPDVLPEGAPGWARSLQEIIEEPSLYVRGSQQAYPLEHFPAAQALQGESSSVDDVEAEVGGQRIPLEIWSSPVFDEQGRVQYAVSAFRNITQQVEDEAKIQRRLAVEGALAEISTRFVRAADLDQAIPETLAIVGVLLGFDRLFLVQVRPDQGQMDMTHEWHAPGLPSLRPEVQAVSLADLPWLLEMLQDGGIIYVQDAAELPPQAIWEQRILETHFGGRRCVLPIWVGAELSGFLACTSHSGLSPNLENEVQVLETVAGMLGSSLQRVQALATLERRVSDRTQELSTLYRVTTLTSTAQPLETTLVRSLDVILAALDSPMGTVHLQDDQESPLRLIAHQGFPLETIDELGVSLPQGMWWQQVLAQDRPLLLLEDPCDGPQTLPWACLAGVQAYLGVPIQVGGVPVGVLSVFGESGHEFTAEEMALLTTIADQLGVAIESDRLRRRAEQARLVQERQRLARDLHDAVTQSLYSLTLFAEAARETSGSGQPDKVQQYLVRMGQTAHHALKEMRLLIFQLRPPVLEREELAGALEHRLEAVERRAGVEASLIGDWHDFHLPPESEEALYRIAQEMLNNVLKHAAATKVVVTLNGGNEAVQLAVRDNGQGFDPRIAAEGGGMGLAGIRQRIEELGGTVTISSAPGQGTEVRVDVPIPGEQESEQEVPG